VILQTLLSVTSEVTQITGERFFPRVYQRMALQFIIVYECFIAYRTGHILRSLPSAKALSWPLIEYVSEYRSDFSLSMCMEREAVEEVSWAGV